MSRPVESQRDQFPHRVAAVHTAMPMPMPEGIRIDHRHYFDGGGMVEAFLPGHGNWKGTPDLVGYLGYEPHGEIGMVEVHPDHRRHGIADAMWDRAAQEHPDLHHSEDRTDLGSLWVDHEQSRHVTAADWSQPSHLNTPLYGPDERRQFYHPTEFTHRHEFSPTEFNPWAESIARPSVRWKPTAPEQDTLDLDLPSHFTTRPGLTQDGINELVHGKWQSMFAKGSSPDGVYPVDRKPVKLYRGVNLDLRHPAMQQVHRALWGPEYSYPSNFAEETENPGLFPQPDHTPDPRGFDNPELGQKILDHINDWHPDVGMGRHWSTNVGVAKDFSGHNYPASQPALISAEWLGRGEDPYRTDAYGNYTGENEITMMPGAPLRVTQVHLRHPSTGKWHPVLGTGPQHREAAFDDDEDEENEDEDDGTYCASCGPDDPDWCESCGQCKSCDSHEEHCEKCGPADSDWCESCDTCSHCDPEHETHCPSCGPGDYDWCEDCGECKSCDWHEEHCPYCGPGGGDWCENCESCKSCGDCECDPNAEPLHYDTPLYKEKERPWTKEYNERGERMRLFLPHEINPASAADSRPMVHFPENEDEDPVLLGDNLVYSNGIDRIPASTTGAELYRGLTINLKKHPELAPLRRAIYGDEKESYYSGDPASANPSYDRKRVVQPGMFPGPFSDKELTAPPAHPDRLHQYLPDILDHLDNYVGYRGLGEHWSTHISQADSFSNPGSPWGKQNGELPVRLTGRWYGHGEDPYRPNTGEEQAGQFHEEREISLRPHAPLRLTDLEIYHPKTHQWHSLMDLPDPIRVHARRRR